MGWELETVEKPFVEQLQGLGWGYVQGCIDDPAKTGRKSFAEVLQEDVLREQLRKLNLREGKPWLDEARISEAVAALTRIGAAKLMEANQTATERLLLGVTVDGLPDWDGGRGQTIRFMDWDNPHNNTFTVINQYRVDCPPGYDSGKAFIIPDVVLLVNGLPLVVVECKSPSVTDPLAEAVDQLRRYSNQRRANFEVEENEGNEALFHTNQFLIATSFDAARVGCIGAMFEHFTRWQTVVGPDGRGSEAETAAQLGKSSLSEQERLIAGMLEPARLLDLIRHFILFTQTGGQTVKLICRYQQYRAVNKAIQRLLTGKTRAQDGEHDRRGGIIWHTQGSGKSLTLVFLVKKLRTQSALRRFKVVVVTDRKDLQTQLSATAALTGEIVDIASNTTALKTLVKRKGPGLVFAMIQKYREADAIGEAPLKAEDMPESLKVREPSGKAYSGKPSEVLNEDESILVLVDEAHRTQAGDLHANLLAGLPNCARIGFTGTPIIMGEKKRTHEIFGEFIDRYTIKESEEDGATVPVLYEGRTAKGAVKDGASLDELFEDLFRERSPEELEAIKRKYATKGQIFEAPALIAEKAKDMLRHYVTYILPNGYKAQVVAYSRLAVIRYYTAFLEARDELLAEAEALPPEDKALDDEALCLRPPKVQARVQAWRFQETLRAIEFAPVISGGNNDDSAWKAWTETTAQDGRIKRFKKPLFHADPKKTDPLAFLIVKSMLLTGFDAPIEAVMYLDRPIREAELLQAIARVNRTGHGKRAGIVVDYFGVAHHLKQALAVYTDEDVQGALQSLKDQIPILRARYLRVMEAFRSRGIESLDDSEACVAILANKSLRNDFSKVWLKQFLDSLDLVLPRPEGLPFVRDAKKLAFIYARARNRYKDTPELGKDVGAKVRKLIDDHVIALGIDPKIPPISLTDADFDTHVSRQANDRAKASEMEHAIRAHIRKHLDEDPVLYRKLSERLRDILKQLDQQWDELVAALQKIIDDLLAGKTPENEGMPEVPEHCLPFLRELIETVAGEKLPDGQLLDKLAELTVDLVEHIAEEIKLVGFWRPTRKAQQERLQTALFEKLIASGLVDITKVEALVDRLMALARANHEKLVQS